MWQARPRVGVSAGRGSLQARPLQEKPLTHQSLAKPFVNKEAFHKCKKCNEETQKERTSILPWWATEVIQEETCTSRGKKGPEGSTFCPLASSGKFLVQGWIWGESRQPDERHWTVRISERERMKKKHKTSQGPPKAKPWELKGTWWWTKIRYSGWVPGPEKDTGGKPRKSHKDLYVNVYSSINLMAKCPSMGTSKTVPICMMDHSTRRKNKVLVRLKTRLDLKNKQNKNSKLC